MLEGCVRISCPLQTVYGHSGRMHMPILGGTNMRWMWKAGVDGWGAQSVALVIPLPWAEKPFHLFPRLLVSGALACGLLASHPSSQGLLHRGFANQSGHA